MKTAWRLGDRQIEGIRVEGVDSVNGASPADSVDRRDPMQTPSSEVSA